MENDEAAFKVLFTKYLAWKESQQHQTDGYIYEKSFVEFIQGFNQELFELSLQGKEDETVPRKKKSRPV